MFVFFSPCDWHDDTDTATPTDCDTNGADAEWEYLYDGCSGPFYPGAHAPQPLDSDERYSIESHTAFVMAFASWSRTRVVPVHLPTADDCTGVL